MLRAYAHALCEEETDFSFTDFDGRIRSLSPTQLLLARAFVTGARTQGQKRACLSCPILGRDYVARPETLRQLELKHGASERDHPRAPAA